jgi:hypothetical protein
VHQQRLFDLWQLWDREVRKRNPDSCVIPNTGGGATSSLDMKKIGELAPTLMADRQAPARPRRAVGLCRQRWFVRFWHFQFPKPMDSQIA